MQKIEAFPSTATTTTNSYVTLGTLTLPLGHRAIFRIKNTHGTNSITYQVTHSSPLADGSFGLVTSLPAVALAHDEEAEFDTSEYPASTKFVVQIKSTSTDTAGAVLIAGITGPNPQFPAIANVTVNTGE